ncbi:MAG: DUF6531 domain-containing protein, partial [Propionicimonas sp.]|nr:DUF6531 domain-containing protein [Propionicimonas sp.]
VGADLAALADRQVASAVLGGYEYSAHPVVSELCAPIAPGSTGADLLAAQCGRPLDMTIQYRADGTWDSDSGWRADATAVARRVVKGQPSTGTVAGFAVGHRAYDPEDGVWDSGSTINAPQLRLVYSGYPAPRPLTLGQTFGCDCWAGASTGNQALAGDPVNTATGALVEQFTDLGLAGLGVPLVLSRTYTSLDTRSGPFGPGWSSSFEAGLETTSSGELVLTDGSGTRSRFGTLPGG